MMRLLGAELVAVEAGRVAIAAPVRPETSQQHGYAHAGLAWTIGDSAAGYSALSLTGAGEEVLTSEMKIHLLAPARGARLVAEGRVLRAGRRLIVVAAEIWAEIWAEDAAAPRRHVATMLGTMIPLAGGE
ncbi:PaaI family thioesterase [Amaricoccus sp.]|uniref:PaaI family thioesterase n=1 Tax=Amaricoccus sp. TaxID=1872485 RepID=UPI001B514BF9|nr:PaaI family thioesterase [Amaricoccus sp.]MBP7001436.1 PaaI family thioesterase [Amaricoccus sp.]